MIYDNKVLQYMLAISGSVFGGAIGAGIAYTAKGEDVIANIALDIAMLSLIVIVLCVGIGLFVEYKREQPKED